MTRRLVLLPRSSQRETRCLSILSSAGGSLLFFAFSDFFFLPSADAFLLTAGGEGVAVVLLTWIEERKEGRRLVGRFPRDVFFVSDVSRVFMTFTCLNVLPSESGPPPPPHRPPPRLQQDQQQRQQQQQRLGAAAGVVFRTRPGSVSFLIFSFSRSSFSSSLL